MFGVNDFENPKVVMVDKQYYAKFIEDLRVGYGKYSQTQQRKLPMFS